MNSFYAKFCIMWVEVTTLIHTGICLSILNPSQPALMEFINETYEKRHSVPASAEFQNYIANLCQVGFDIGAGLGCLISRFTIVYFSRRINLIIAHVFWLLSCVLMSPVAMSFSSFEAIVAGRIISGVARGVSFTSLPLFVTEVTVRKHLALFQGLQVYMIQLGLVIGALISQPWMFGTRDNLAILFALPAVFPLALILFSPWLPETPSSLVQREMKAVQSESETVKLLEHAAPSFTILRKLRHKSLTDEDLKEELQQIKDEIEDDLKIKKATFSDFFSIPHYKRQLFASVILAASGHFTLLTSFNLYSSDLFLRAGVDRQYTSYYTLSLFVINLFITPLFVFMLTRVGAKKIYLCGGGMVVIGQLLLTISTIPSINCPGWLSLMAGVMIVLFGSGPQAGSFVLPNELTTFVTRPLVLWSSSVMFYSAASAVCLLVPWMLHFIDGFAFLPWMIVFIISMIYVWKFVPDTHQKSAAEVQELLKQ